MAVHFCPAFCVMSRSTSFTKNSQVSDPGAASGPSTAALRLSASTFTRTEWRITAGRARIFWPVSLEPVKATTSWGPRWSSRSPTPPTSSDSAPSGRTACASRISTIRWARIAEEVAGLVRTGTPASSATAAFSNRPQAGKLKALMCTATPWRGTAMCWPWKRGLRPRVIPSPSASTRAAPRPLPISA